MLTYSCKADFVTKVVEATDTVLGILVAVILDEAESEGTLVEAKMNRESTWHTPCTVLWSDR